MKLSDFKYKLPEKLIAKYPAEKRDGSNLMVLDREKKTIDQHVFSDISNYFKEGDCLVVNETKVFPARLMGTKDKTDAQVEIFLLRDITWISLKGTTTKVLKYTNMVIAKITPKVIPMAPNTSPTCDIILCHILVMRKTIL